MKTILTIMFLLLFVPLVAQNTGVELTVTGFEHSDGIAVISLFNDEDGFPRELNKAYRVIKVKIENQKIITKIEEVPPGYYAITVFHDINENGINDKNWIGMPTEPVALTNYKELARPEFEKAKIELKPVVTHTIALEVKTLFE